jgi:hypothetical protein
MRYRMENGAPAAAIPGGGRARRGTLLPPGAQFPAPRRRWRREGESQRARERESDGVVERDGDGGAQRVVTDSLGSSCHPSSRARLPRVRPGGTG